MGQETQNYLWPPGAIECPECGYDGTRYADCGETFRVVLIEEQYHTVIGVDDTAREHMHVAIEEHTSIHDYRDSEIQCMACYHTFELPRHLVPEIESADDWDQHMRKMVDGHLEYLRGQVLELGCDIERYPHFWVQEGTRCRVEEWDGDVCYLKLIEHHPKLDEWDNCIIVSVIDDGPSACNDLLRLRPAPDFAQRKRPAPALPTCQDCGAPATESGTHDMGGKGYRRCLPCETRHTMPAPRRTPVARTLPTPWDPEPDI